MGVFSSILSLMVIVGGLAFIHDDYCADDARTVKELLDSGCNYQIAEKMKSMTGGR